MEEQEQHKKFHIGGDQKAPLGVQDELPFDVKHRHVDRLNNRLTIIAILLPCIIGAVVFFVYLDIKKNVSLVQNSGTKNRTQLAANLDQKLEDLSVRVKELEVQTKAVIAGLESKIATLEKNLQQSNSNIKELSGSAKTAKKDIGWISTLQKKNNKQLNASVKKVSKTISDFKQAVEPELSDIKAAVNSSAAEQSRLTAQVKNLTTDRVTASEVKILLEKEKQFYKLRLKELDQRLTRTLDAAIAKMEENNRKANSVTEKKQEAPASNSGASTTPANGSSPSIREQDL